MWSSGGIAFLITSALYDVTGQLHVPAALPTRKESQVHTEHESGWAPELVAAHWRIDESCVCRKSYDFLDVQPVG